MKLLGDRPPIPADDEWDDWIIKLMKHCWHQRSAKRPTFSEIVEIITTQLESERKPRSIDHPRSNSLSIHSVTRSRSKSPSLRRKKDIERMPVTKSTFTEPISVLERNSSTSFETDSENSNSTDEKFLSSAPRGVRKKKKKQKKQNVSGYSSDSPVLLRQRGVSDAPSIRIFPS